MDENYRLARERLRQTVAAARKVEIAQVLLLADMIDGALPVDGAPHTDGVQQADGVSPADGASPEGGAPDAAAAEAEGERARREQQVAEELAPEIARMRDSEVAVERHLLLEVMSLRARFPQAWRQMAQGDAPEWMAIRVEQIFSEMGQGIEDPWWSELV